MCRGAPAWASQFQFRAGNRYVLDYQHKSQTAHIMEHMAFGASDGFATAHEYDATFTKNGAIYNAYTDDVSMVYEATCADFEWSRVLGLQKYAICQPHFNQDDFASEVGAVRSELIGYLSQADRVLWPRVAQAMGDDTKTFQEGLDSIPNITAEDIREHWRRTHTAGNLRFVVAGNFVGRIGQLREILNSFELGAGDRLPIAVDEMHSAPAFAIRRKDVPGIGLAISLVVPRKLSDAENEAMSLLNHILNGTLHSRIQGEARRRGLLYYMWSQLSTFEHNSSWDFGAQVSVSNLPAVVDLVTNEMQHLEVTDDNFLALGIIEIAPDQSENLPVRVQMKHCITGEIIPIKIEEEDAFALTPREKEILSLASQGFSSKEIAEKLFISTYTVNRHRQNIREKFNAESLIEAIDIARRKGVL